jgi:hypothetical protein
MDIKSSVHLPIGPLPFGFIEKYGGEIEPSCEASNSQEHAF